LQLWNKKDAGDRNMRKTVVKIDLGQAIQNVPVVIELGCGKSKRAGAIGIDYADLPGVDVIADIEEGLGFLPDESVDKLYAFSVFEHVRNFEFVMKEIVRVLKKTGRAHVFVPHFSNPYYYSDPTHVRFFGLYSFYYFVNLDNQIRRKVPDYYFETKINIHSKKLIFDSPFLIGKIFKRLLGCTFNICTPLQEFYESNLCYIFPCYGIEIVFGPCK
jgi:SAM-dependent methyltransferase